MSNGLRPLSRSLHRRGSGKGSFSRWINQGRWEGFLAILDYNRQMSMPRHFSLSLSADIILSQSCVILPLTNVDLRYLATYFHFFPSYTHIFYNKKKKPTSRLWLHSDPERVTYSPLGRVSWRIKKKKNTRKSCERCYWSKDFFYPVLLRVGCI